MTPTATPSTFTCQAAASGDDGWARDTANDFSGNAANGFIGELDTGLTAYMHWFTRCVVNIPYQSTIHSAYWTWTASDDKTVDTVKIVYSVNDTVVDPAAPTSYAEVIGLARTTNTTSQNITENWTTDSTYVSSDFASSVQEVVSELGWVSGEHMIFLIDDNTSTHSDTDAYRTFYSWDGDAAKDPTITISYSPP